MTCLSLVEMYNSIITSSLLSILSDSLQDDIQLLCVPTVTHSSHESYSQGTKDRWQGTKDRNHTIVSGLPNRLKLATGALSEGDPPQTLPLDIISINVQVTSLDDLLSFH